MKKVLFTAAAGMLCFFISCKDATSTSNTSSSSNATNDSSLAKNRRVMKAIETGDSAVINSLIADDAVDHQGGPNGMDVKGGDSVRHMLIDMHNHVKHLKMEVIADAANGDYIFTLGHMTGTIADANMGMPAGTTMDERGVDVVKIKDGKMVEHWSFVDPAAMMKHMQNMPAGPMGNMGGDKLNSGKMDTTHK